MAAPILWAPGTIAFFLQEKTHAHKIPRFRGGYFGFFGGGSADFIFMGARIFLKLGNASLFTKCLFTIFAPLNPPPPNQQSDGFPLELLLKGPQIELRTLSQNCEQTLQRLRTNRIANKPAFLNNCRPSLRSLRKARFIGLGRTKKENFCRRAHLVGNFLEGEKEKAEEGTFWWGLFLANFNDETGEN